MTLANTSPSGSKFDRLCIQHRWSNSALGELTGVRRQTVWRWRQPIGSPQFTRPNDDHLTALNRIFEGRVDANTFVEIPAASSAADKAQPALASGV